MTLGKLEPINVRENIILSSLYITAFDLLEIAIKERTKDFLTLRFKYSKGRNNIKLAELEYKREVTNKYHFKDKRGKRYKDDYRACALWLKDMGTINLTEVDIILKIRSHRNDVVHKLPLYIANEENNIDLNLFKDLQSIYKKISLFWIRLDVFEVNSEFDNVETQDNEIEATLFWDYILACIDNKE